LIRQSKNQQTDQNTLTVPHVANKPCNISKECIILISYHDAQNPSVHSFHTLYRGSE